MKPRALDYFNTIYICGSLGKASAELNISQAALSKSLRVLEEEMGAPLFLRRSWGLEPTKFGQALRARSLVINKEYQSLERDFHAIMNSQTGSIQIGANLGALISLIPKAISSMQTSFPGVRISLEEGRHEALLGMLMNGELDIVVATKPLSELPREISSEPLIEDPFVIAMKQDHPLVHLTSETDCKDLLSYPWVLPPDHGILRPRIVSLFSGLGLKPPTPTVETVSFAASFELMQLSNFLSLQPMSIMQSELAFHKLAWIRDPVICVDRTISCIWRERNDSMPAVYKFLEVLREESRRYRTRNLRGFQG